MIKILLIFSLFTFANFFQVNSCNKNKVGTNINTQIIEENNAQNDSGKSLMISELNSEKPSGGTFETEGFVIKISTCPPCPPDAQCEPCLPDSIVVSVENKRLENFNLTEKDLVIFTDKAESFVEGKKYKYKIKISDTKTTRADFNDVKLISATLLK